MSKKKQSASPPEYKVNECIERCIRYKGEYQYQVNIRRKGHPTRIKTFETLEAAREDRDETLRGMKRHTYVDDRILNQTTFGDLIEAYRESDEFKALGSYKDSDMVLKKLQEKGKIAEYMLSRLTNKIARDYVKTRRKEVMWSTVARQRTMINAVFTWGIGTGDYPGLRNPFAGIPAEKPDKKKGEKDSRDRRVTAEEEAAIIYALQFLTPIKNKRGKVVGYRERQLGEEFSRLKALCICLALATACRRGELADGMFWGNTYDRHIHLIKTKNGDERDVPLTPEAQLVIEELRQRTGTPSARLRFNGKIFPFTGNALYQSWKRAIPLARMKYLDECRAANVTPDPTFLHDIRIHDLRHEAASQFAAYVDIKTLMKIGGWRDVRSCMRYYNPTGEELADLIKDVERKPIRQKVVALRQAA